MCMQHWPVHKTCCILASPRSSRTAQRGSVLAAKNLITVRYLRGAVAVVRALLALGKQEEHARVGFVVLIVGLAAPLAVRFLLQEPHARHKVDEAEHKHRRDDRCKLRAGQVRRAQHEHAEPECHLPEVIGVATVVPEAVFDKLAAVGRVLAPGRLLAVGHHLDAKAEHPDNEAHHGDGAKVSRAARGIGNEHRVRGEEDPEALDDPGE
mmetsp:Transcript_21870/g.69855  ORF Transcript_21870/g.69855 Transcript_21870/m.69855 type:complete len:209 (+) Transcript_21870:259-885(+)